MTNVLEPQKFNLADWNPLEGKVPIQSLEDMLYYTDPFFKYPFVVETAMISRERYMNVLTYLQNVISSCFEIEECRHYQVKFKLYKTSDKIYEMPFNMIVMNLLVWIPLARFGTIQGVLDDSIIFDNPTENIPGDRFNEWRNIHIIDHIRSLGLDDAYLNKDFAEMNHRIAMLCCNLSIIMGNNYSMHDTFEFMEDPVLGHIMRGLEDGARSTNETEAEIRSREDTFVNRLKTHYKGHPMERMLTAGGVMKTKQLMELYGSVGHKPNSEGHTIPSPIRSSYLIGGLNRPSDNFIDAMGAYKSLINNKDTMGNIGHFVKSITMFTESLHLDKSCIDCGTKHLIPYHIKNKQMLHKLVNKYYLKDRNSTEYDYVKKTDTHLIGKTIWVRSIITCAAGEDSCCHTCLGRNSQSMSVLYSMGAFEGEETGKNMEQNILSTKHLLVTNSVDIDIINSNIFTVVESEIFVTAENLGEDETLNDYAIRIDPNDLEKMDDMDDDSLYNTFLKSGEIEVVNLVTGEVKLVQFRLDDADRTIPPIYIDQDVLAMLKADDNNMLYLRDIDEDQRLFVYDVVNNEVVKKIHELKDFLWTKKAQGGCDDLYALGQKILEYFIDAKVTADIIAGEVIINRMLRSVDDPYRRPNFKKKDFGKFTLCTIQDGLKNNKSITTGIAFQDIRRQILADNLDERTAPSDMDPFFREKVKIPVEFLENKD